MSESYDDEPNWEQLRAKVIGLGEQSFHKSYYPQLMQKITDLEAARGKAEENEHKFRMLFEHISDGTALIDMSTRSYSLGNQALANMLGYTQEELFHITLQDILLIEELPAIREQFDRQMRGEIKIVRDVPLRRKDGSLLYTDINATQVMLEGHSMLLCVLRDVTERREAEAALEKAYLDTVLALSRMMDARDAYTGDHSQNLAGWAKRVAERLGCTKEEIRTIHWAALLHDIGKISVPDEILRKAAPLNDAE